MFHQCYEAFLLRSYLYVFILRQVSTLIMRTLLQFSCSCKRVSTM